MEDKEFEERGISIGDIFRTMFSQKWLALILFVAITLVGVIGIKFGVNNLKRTYTVSFVYRLPGSSESPVTYSYPDGKVFRFTDMVTSESLNKVKQANADFSDIDVEEMVKNGDIMVMRKMEEVAEGSKVYEATYNLSVNAKYFKSKELAREFLIEVTQVPVEYLAQMDIDYDTYLTTAAKAETYDVQLTYLQSQVNYISSMYSSFISTYGGSFMVNTGDENVPARPLSAYKADMDVFSSNNRISQLKNEALENGYVKSERAISEYESLRFEYDRQLQIEQQVYEDLIALLEKNGSTAIFDNPQIIEQNRTILNLQLKIDDLDNYINNYKNGQAENKQFADAVEELSLEIAEFTKDVAAVATAVYANASTVSYNDANIVLTEGEISLTMTVAVSLVAGLVIAAIVAYIVGRVKMRKAQTAANEVPVFGEAVLQTAVTDATDETKEHEEDNEKDKN